MTRFIVPALAVLLCLSTAAFTQEQQQQPVIEWEEGPTVGKLGSIAEISVPEGYRFAGRKGAQKFLELTHNIPSGDELGVIIPAGESDQDMWFVIFEFQEVGYVKDDEKDKIDADALLASIKRGTEEANKMRAEKGWQPFHVLGWEKPPFYNDTTHNLTWAIRGRGTGEAVNYSTRVLGRRGTMNIDLVLPPEQLATVVPKFDELLTTVSYVEGNRYADFVKGDKVAAYGLTALIAGGAGAAAIKSGALGKLWKVIVAGVVALLAGIKKIIAAITGRRSPDVQAKANTAGQG